MTVEFECATRIAAPPAAAFDASCDIDLHLESMRSSGERAIAGVTSGRIGPGEQVTWRARHFGVRFRMTSRITAYERPSRFVDEQLGRLAEPVLRRHLLRLFEERNRHVAAAAERAAGDLG